MKRLKNKLSNTLYIVLCLFSLVSCKQTYYKYDLEKIENACKDRGGLNRFYSDLDDMVCWCNNGTVHRIKP